MQSLSSFCLPSATRSPFASLLLLLMQEEIPKADNEVAVQEHHSSLCGLQLQEEPKHHILWPDLSSAAFSLLLSLSAYFQHVVLTETHGSSCAAIYVLCLQAGGSTMQ